MNELLDISTAFASLVADGKPAALATIIAVAGSTYRRPGARMLIAEDGRTWGGVSGGCLDRDVTRRGRIVIDMNVAQRHVYDTGEDGDLPAGITTGCGGTVEVLMQRVDEHQRGPMTLIEQVCRERVSRSVATVCASSDATRYAIGDTFELAPDIELPHLTGSGTTCFFPSLTRCESNDVAIELFVERLTPPQSLVIFGSGPDVSPVVTIAKTLGWHVTVVASHPAIGVRERFTRVDACHVTDTDDPLRGVVIPDDAAVVLMTHTYSRDLAILPRLPKSIPYLGMLGPRHRTDRLLHALDCDFPRGILHAPVGLDLGADTPAEIALSMVAEIQSTVRHAKAIPLRDRPGPIHAVDVSANKLTRPDVGAGGLNGGEFSATTSSPTCPL